MQKKSSFVVLFVLLAALTYAQSETPTFSWDYNERAVIITVSFPSGTYAYIDSPYAIKFEVKYSSETKSIFKKPIMPKGTRKDDEIIMRGSNVVEIPYSGGLNSLKDARGQFVISSQLCNEIQNSCYPPEEFTFTLSDGKITLGEQTDNSPELNNSVNSTNTINSPLKNNTPKKTKRGFSEVISDLLKENTGRPIFSFILAFIGGVLASLTPCVYPVIPITIGLFSRMSIGQLSNEDKIAGKKQRSSSYRTAAAFIYVLGMILVYTALGVIAGLTGGLFGSLTNTPIFFGIVTLVFFALALSLFEIYEIKMPAFLSGLKSGSPNRSDSLGGIFFMGIVTGLVASPCVGPIVFFLLTGVMQAGNPFLGGILMLGFSAGMSLLFLLLAIFSQLSSKLPRSGNWMVRVKILIGVFVFGSALYFADLLFKMIQINSLYYILLVIVASSVTVILSFIKLVSLYGKEGYRHSILILILIALVSGYFGYSSVKFGGPDWLSDYRTAAVTSKETGKPVFLDLYADWCTICRKVEKEIIADTQLYETLQTQFIPVKMNYDHHREYLEEKFGVKSVPFIAIISPDGDIIKVWAGFDNSSTFIESLKSEIETLNK